MWFVCLALVGLSFTLIGVCWLGVFDFSCLIVRVMIAALVYVVLYVSVLLLWVYGLVFVCLIVVFVWGVCFDFDCLTDC